MDAEIVQVVYVVAAFLSVGLSSWINWKANGADEPFNAAKFLSAYLRTAWAIIPLALGLAGSLGISVEGLLAVVGVALGVDNAVLQSQNLGQKKPKADAEGTPVSVSS